MRKTITILLNLVLFCAQAGASYMDNASDSLLVLPKPLFGLENGRIRYGLQFSVMKTLIHHGKGFYPYLETGITLFDRIDESPDDKKHVFLKLGALKELGPVAVSLETGLLYGNGRFAPTAGIGVWRFIPFVPGIRKKTLKDFPDYASFVKWRNEYNRARKKLLKGCAVSLRIYHVFSVAPSLSGGVFFDLFL